EAAVRSEDRPGAVGLVERHVRLQVAVEVAGDLHAADGEQPSDGDALSVGICHHDGDRSGGGAERVEVERQMRRVDDGDGADTHAVADVDGHGVGEAGAGFEKAGPGGGRGRLVTLMLAVLGTDAGIASDGAAGPGGVSLMARTVHTLVALAYSWNV